MSVSKDRNQNNRHENDPRDESLTSSQATQTVCNHKEEQAQHRHDWRIQGEESKNWKRPWQSQNQDQCSEK